MESSGSGPHTGPGTGEGPLEPGEQREWLSQLDRRLSTRTYAGAAAVVLALAAAIVAIVLAVDARDNSASSADLKRLERTVGGVADDASASADAQKEIDALSGRLDSLEDQVGGLSGADQDAQGRLDVVEDDIEDLRQEISDLNNSEAGSGGTSPSERDK